MNKYISGHGQSAKIVLEIENASEFDVIYAYQKYLEDIVRKEAASDKIDMGIINLITEEHGIMDHLKRCAMKEWEADDETV